MKRILMIFAAAAIFASCNKDDAAGSSTSPFSGSMDELNVPEGFDWRTSQVISFDISKFVENSDKVQVVSIFTSSGEHLMTRRMQTTPGSEVHLSIPMSESALAIDVDGRHYDVAVSGKQTFLKKGGGNGKGNGNGGGGSTYPANAPCPCDGRMENLTLEYSGPNGATLLVAYKASGNSYAFSDTFPNLTTGQIISIDGFDPMGNSGKPPRLKSQTFLSVDGGANYWNVHTSCSEYILGNIYGPFEVVGFTDGQSRRCENICVDTDGDGCCDDVDAFPNDPNLCDATYIPGENTYASFAYEDLWPTYGDFDFNDMVINRNTVLYLDPNGDVVEADHSFELAAAGAGQQNGFGFRMPGVSPADVSMVTSSRPSTQNYTTIESNGVEAGQSDAVVIVFENWKEIVTMTQNGKFYNTNPAEGLGYSDSIVIHVEFATPQPVANVLEIDPFLIKDGAKQMNRDIEIHLPWYGPTDLVDDTYFKTRNDWSAYPGVGNNYVDSGNIPWAIETAGGAFEWPLERVDIRDAYKKFSQWASSGSPTDWYTNPSNGYRDQSLLF